MPEKGHDMGKNIFKGDTVPGLVTAVLGGTVLAMTLTGKNMQIVPSRLTGNAPGPGFFPVICASLLLIFGILLFIRGLRQNGAVNYFVITDEIRGNIKVALAAFGGLVAMLVAWKLLSPLFKYAFITCAFVYAVYLNILFKRSKLFTILFSIGITALIYFMFMEGFSVTFKI